MRGILATIILGLIFSDAAGSNIDERIETIIDIYHLAPKECASPSSTPRTLAGERLFESRLLSGDKDISCRDCHLEKFHITDGLPLAIGVGGEGEGRERVEDRQGTIVPRNTLTLVGRGHSAFEAFFWDGKAERDRDGRIVTQFGNQISERYEGLLSAAASLPLLERDEFLGQIKVYGENPLAASVNDKYYQERYWALSRAIRNRLAEGGEESRELRDLLSNAGIAVQELELADIGNLLADFIRSEFPCTKSAWDKYLEGNLEAISAKQKRGAVLFFGKGRCATCHSGPLLSDFKFHSIGAPQGPFGPHSRHRDIGRAAVTNRGEDLFKFRTPPLLDVAATPPYGHNGVFATLEEVVIHHFNPVAYFTRNPTVYKADFFRVGRLLDSRTATLSAIEIDSEEELSDLVSFLKSL